ncbi:hypothetical protein [Streptomyces chartreusis]
MTPIPPRPAAELRHRAADALADAVREQWAAEFRLRGLQDPEPVDVRWVAADPRLADHPENVRPHGHPRAGRGRGTGHRGGLVWLAASGRMPWRLMAFLDEAHRRGVLRQSGAYYEFRHLRLQRQLASEPAPHAEDQRPHARR